MRWAGAESRRFKTTPDTRDDSWRVRQCRRRNQRRPRESQRRKQPRPTGGVLPDV